MSRLGLTLKVKVDELVKHLRTNKEEHLKEYSEAVEKYFEQLCENLEELRLDAESGIKREDGYRIQLQHPQDASANYDKYINMLEMTEDDIIEIGVDEYEKFVEDNWEWVIGAKLLNSSYLA